MDDKSKSKADILKNLATLMEESRRNKRVREVRERIAGGIFLFVIVAILVISFLGT